jgi:hypothetical protein
MLLQFFERRQNQRPRSDAQKLRPFQSYLLAEEMIDVAREADEYNNIAM